MALCIPSGLGSGLTSVSNLSRQSQQLRFTRAKIDTECSKTFRARLFGGSFKDILAPRDLKIGKPGCHDRGLELCFQQSAGDSAGPQIDVFPGAVAHFLLHRDVRDLQTSGGF